MTELEKLREDKEQLWEMIRRRDDALREIRKVVNQQIRGLDISPM